MLGSSSGGTGTGQTGYGISQHGYQARSRGRGGYDGQEERYVEGDLFGSAKARSGFKSETPIGKPPRPAYNDGTPSNTFANGGGGAGGFDQNPMAHASPFARRPTQPNGFMPGSAGSSIGRAGGSFGGGYARASEPGGVRPDFGSSPGIAGEVALVPVDDGAGNRGKSVMDDDEDDMPTRFLAFGNDDHVGASSSGLRQRRMTHAGIGGRADAGLDRPADADVQRATWVVVWGVPPGRANDVLTRFLQFGRVEEQSGAPGSNWLYLKYATRLQADKAIAAGHGSRLTNTVMLGVQRVADDEEWRALREGRVPPVASAAPVLADQTPARPTTSSNRTPASLSSRARVVDDRDLLGGPPQRPQGRRGVCSKMMAFFGFH